MADDETTPAPLSDAEIAGIRKRLNNLWQARYDTLRLLETLAAYRSPRLDDTEQYMLEEIRDPERGKAFLHALLEAHGQSILTLDRENAGMREIVAAVAGMYDNGYGVCVVCGQSVNQAHYGYGKNEPHNPSCTVPRARALLAGTPAGGATGATAGEEGE